MTKMLTSAATPPPEVLAMDSNAVRDGFGNLGLLRSTLALAFMLGNPAPEIRGTSWINVVDTGAHSMSLNDGVVRLIGIGGQYNGVEIIPALERLTAEINKGQSQKRVDGIFLVTSAGHWGVKFVTPEEESAKLRNYFTAKRPAKIPVAIWAGPKQMTLDGGLTPTPSPTIAAFKIPMVPAVAIVDKRGNVRRVFLRMFDRDTEAVTLGILKYLIDEPQH
jgi:hypothetical protein